MSIFSFATYLWMATFAVTVILHKVWTTSIPSFSEHVLIYHKIFISIAVVIVCYYRVPNWLIAPKRIRYSIALGIVLYFWIMIRMLMIFIEFTLPLPELYLGDAKTNTTAHYQSTLLFCHVNGILVYILSSIVILVLPFIVSAKGNINIRPWCVRIAFIWASVVFLTMAIDCVVRTSPPITFLGEYHASEFYCENNTWIYIPTYHRLATPTVIHSTASNISLILSFIFCTIGFGIYFLDCFPPSNSKIIGLVTFLVVLLVNVVLRLVIGFVYWIFYQLEPFYVYPHRPSPNDGSYQHVDLWTIVCIVNECLFMVGLVLYVVIMVMRCMNNPPRSLTLLRDYPRGNRFC